VLRMDLCRERGRGHAGERIAVLAEPRVNGAEAVHGGFGGAGQVVPGLFGKARQSRDVRAVDVLAFPSVGVIHEVVFRGLSPPPFWGGGWTAAARSFLPVTTDPTFPSHLSLWC
jgi:hypothetical protein